MTSLPTIQLVGTVWALLLGAVALAKSPRTIDRWAFAAGMLVLAVESALSAIAITASTLELEVHWLRVRHVAVSFLPLPWILFAVTYGRGNYAAYVKRVRPILAIAALIPLVPIIGFSEVVSLQSLELVPQPNTVIVRGWPANWTNACMVATAVLVLMNLERTYRAAVGVMLWRIKYVMMGLALLFAVRIYTSSQALLYSTFNLSLESFRAGALLLACLLMTVAALRAGMFGADIYPSQTVIFRSLTVFIVGLYLVMVGVLANVVTRFGGDPAFPIKAFLILVLLVTLGCLLASARLRLIARRFVSRHFNRPIYDYRQIWRSFNERTSAMPDELGLCRQAVNFVSETLDVLSVTIWLTDEQGSRLAFGASTSVQDDRSGKLLSSGANAEHLIAMIRARPEPLDLNNTTEDWAAELRRLNPDYFPRQEGNRMCVPLVAKDQVLGLLNVGDRVSRVPLSIEDIELLKSLADQIAGSLLALRLSRRVLEAKELEAFQSMAAFFVHDLKNTASSLSLMLQNLPTQFDNPEFRQDAVRAVSKGVGRLNDLITRLSTLRQSGHIQKVQSDLMACVVATLDMLTLAPGIVVKRNFAPVPPLMLDNEQFQKVVTNLLINAQEAMKGTGEIELTISKRDSSAVFSVRDTGCGMSPDFVRRSLFRPFQTTKKTGMGIGMFHCRMIVEAHSGRIEVETEEGKGSEFRVVLPLTRESV